MKKLLIGLFVLVSGSAIADTWVMTNQGGGQIVLTDRKCQEEKALFQAYTYTDRAFLNGCWGLLDGKVHVVWEKGQGRKVYELNDFVPDQTSPKKQGTSL